MTLLNNSSFQFVYNVYVCANLVDELICASGFPAKTKIDLLIISSPLHRITRGFCNSSQLLIGQSNSIFSATTNMAPSISVPAQGGMFHTCESP